MKLFIASSIPSENADFAQVRVGRDILSFSLDKWFNPSRTLVLASSPV